MPEKRKHRGAHPEDHRLFAAAKHPRLRRAVSELSWLLSRGYAEPSALKLVGDRHNLTARQRMAVVRSACTDDAVAARSERRIAPEELRGRAAMLDGFNIITTIEAALGGGVLIVGRDGCLRDMASMHGSYRKVSETIPATELIGWTLAELGAARALWLLDRPVSNSGRLRRVLLELAEHHRWDWRVDVIHDPDAALLAAGEVPVASADSMVLDGCGPWVNLARVVVDRHVPRPWVVDLREPADDSQ